ncbi:MAG: hypothetical protein FWD76_06385 [Firmicutes bacterium]|nr:hypothetical protein [Bacillota bacterium]
MKNIVYCIGDAGAKRNDFRAKGRLSNALYIDNDDVALDFCVDGDNYFVATKLPFAKFCVYQYICYQTSLCRKTRISKKQCTRMLKGVGLKVPLHKKIGALSKIEYRAVLIACRKVFNTLNIFINCDGVEFCKKNQRQLDKMVLALCKTVRVYVSISDSRFSDESVPLRIYSKEGDYITMPKTLCRAKNVDVGRIKGLIKNRNLQVNVGEITSVVVCNQ